jgi:hypothetical protein
VNNEKFADLKMCGCGDFDECLNTSGIYSGTFIFV